jgi:hypothetical protein
LRSMAQKTLRQHTSGGKRPRGAITLTRAAAATGGCCSKGRACTRGCNPLVSAVVGLRCVQLLTDGMPAAGQAILCLPMLGL